MCWMDKLGSFVFMNNVRCQIGDACPLQDRPKPFFHHFSGGTRTFNLVSSLNYKTGYPLAKLTKPFFLLLRLFWTMVLSMCHTYMW
jgi:hypothetical protein